MQLRSAGLLRAARAVQCETPCDALQGGQKAVLLQQRKLPTEVQCVLLTLMHCKQMLVPRQQRVAPCCRAVQHCPVSTTATRQGAGLPAVCGAMHYSNALPGQLCVAPAHLRNSRAMALPMPLPLPVTTTESCVRGARQKRRMPARFRQVNRSPTPAPSRVGSHAGRSAAPAVAEERRAGDELLTGRAQERPMCARSVRDPSVSR